jgi:hypothetical protein
MQKRKIKFFSSFTADRNNIRPAQNTSAQENAFIIELEEPIKRIQKITSPSASIKSPIKIKTSFEEIPPPSYEEWTQMTSGQISSNI